MKKSYKISLAVIALVSLFAVSCVKDLTDTVYNGPDMIEFGNPIAKTVTTTTTPKSDSILVQLVGPQRSTDTKVNFVVNASSTAVPADYTIVTPSPIVIPANKSSAWIKFTLNKVTVEKKLIIELTGGDEVQVSQNYKLFTFTLK